MPYCERHYLWFALAAVRCVEGYLSAEVNGQQNRKTIPTPTPTRTSTTPVCQLLGSADAETTPAGTQATAAIRIQRPYAARKGKNG